MEKESKGDIPKKEGAAPDKPEKSPVKRSHHKKPDSEVETKPKRGHYAQKECPYCHTHVGNLGNHIRMKHPAETTPIELTKDSLLGKKTEPVIKAAPIYYCNDCRSELRKGEESCWNCHKVLNWTGL